MKKADSSDNIPSEKPEGVAEKSTTALPLLWLFLFFAVPTLLIFALAFRPSTPSGGVGEGWSLEAIQALFDPNYPVIIWRTFWISAVATILCIVLSIPAGYAMVRVGEKWRSILLIGVVVPFWTNFLIRIFAWRQVLHPEAPIAKFLYAIHIVPDGTLLLYNSGAVLAVSVYSFLPFAILPIYAASEKFDFTLLDAARDLGAGKLRAFLTIFVPGIRGGIATAFLVVFIPLLGSYIIPDLVGGTESALIGNKIAQRNFTDRNIPQAAALAAALTLTILFAGILYPLAKRIWKRQNGKEALS